MRAQAVADDGPPGRARVLVLIGSGETGPQMARVQRGLVKRLLAERGSTDARAISAVVVDTTYGFQANADGITAELVDFHAHRLGVSAGVASLRRADGDSLQREQALARIRAADYVFSGPGSPSYALRHWASMAVPALISDKLTHGGAIVFASAAALTLGRLTLPVYEIYKSGEDPRWLPGLDVLAGLGISAAVVPHWNNGEGGEHDTRFCFIGERRLRELEQQMPSETSILGIDEHTALVVDAGDLTARVEGRGGVTVRHAGSERRHPAGTEIALADMLPITKVERPIAGTRPPSGIDTGRSVADRAATDDLAAVVRDLLTIDEPTAFRARIVALGERARQAEGERARLIEPLIELLLDVRRGARSGGDYGRADEIRSRLEQLGIRLTDEPDGSTDFELR